MVDVTGKNLLQEKLMRETEALAQEYRKPNVPTQQNMTNPIYKQPIQCIDGMFFNSHLYPNLKTIRPVEYGFMPSNKGSYIDESIQKTTQVIGNKIYTINDFERHTIYS